MTDLMALRRSNFPDTIQFHAPGLRRNVFSAGRTFLCAAGCWPLSDRHWSLLKIEVVPFHYVNHSSDLVLALICQEAYSETITGCGSCQAPVD